MPRGECKSVQLSGTVRIGWLRVCGFAVFRVVSVTFLGETFIRMRGDLFLLPNGNDYTYRCYGRFLGWKHSRLAAKNQLGSGRGDF
jgi:hypothetical protein